MKPYDVRQLHDPEDRGLGTVKMFRNAFEFKMSRAHRFINNAVN
jgi:hypothetical protein